MFGSFGRPEKKKRNENKKGVFQRKMKKKLFDFLDFQFMNKLYAYKNVLVFLFSPIVAPPLPCATFAVDSEDKK